MEPDQYHKQVHIKIAKKREQEKRKAQYTTFLTVAQGRTVFFYEILFLFFCLGREPS